MNVYGKGKRRGERAEMKFRFTRICKGMKWIGGLCRWQWTKSMQNSFLTTARKDKSSKAKIQKRSWVKLKCVIKNVNVNVVIIFYCLWCKGKSPEENKYPTIMLNWYLQLYFLNERIKEMRTQKAKRHGCPFRIPSGIQTTMKFFLYKTG